MRGETILRVLDLRVHSATPIHKKPINRTTQPTAMPTIAPLDSELEEVERVGVGWTSVEEVDGTVRKDETALPTGRRTIVGNNYNMQELETH